MMVMVCCQFVSCEMEKRARAENRIRLAHQRGRFPILTRYQRGCLHHHDSIKEDPV